MDFFDVVEKRHSMRRYTDTPVEEEKLQQILATINRAPSAGDLQGYEVYIVNDAVAARTEQNRDTGIKMLLQSGAKLTATEAALFELLKVAKGEKFKAINQIVK